MRISRDHCNLLQSALALLKQLEQTLVAIKQLHSAGSMKLCQTAAAKMVQDAIMTEQDRDAIQNVMD